VIILVNDSSVTNPVVINDCAKAVRNGQNCAFGKFTDEVCETNKQWLESMDSYCRIVWLMSSSVA
jgi:hypothetical protein